LRRFVVGSLLSCCCGAASALATGARAPRPGDALWPLTAVVGGWAAFTFALHACLLMTRRAMDAAAAEEGAGARRRRRRGGGGFARAVLGPWPASLSLLLLAMAAGACLPPVAALRWLALAGGALALWLVYGWPATRARAARWAAEDAAAERDEEGGGGGGGT